MNVPKLKLNLSADAIYLREFKPTEKAGYNCLQVDTMLDAIIKDYEAVDVYCAKMDTFATYLQNQNHILEERNEELSRQLLESEKKVAELRSLTGVSADLSQDQLELIKHIAKLEAALREAGVDPSHI